jgi:hypothetical protein
MDNQTPALSGPDYAGRTARKRLDKAKRTVGPAIAFS